ncbi:hypothetical protein QR680_007796 [Steinernema hermaphroditum]|uniref:Uncharacterized protein n=1 Tax=Steinernema hermaphroditum TaxID=289476 RepID=A0AA39IFN8_9BILA|nr:hypothetical protein QR680_007796 [Steinernema hermaphroditum]
MKLPLLLLLSSAVLVFSSFDLDNYSNDLIEDFGNHTVAKREAIDPWILDCVAGVKCRCQRGCLGLKPGKKYSYARAVSSQSPPTMKLPWLLLLFSAVFIFPSFALKDPYVLGSLGNRKRIVQSPLRRWITACVMTEQCSCRSGCGDMTSWTYGRAFDCCNGCCKIPLWPTS